MTERQPSIRYTQTPSSCERRDARRARTKYTEAASQSTANCAASAATSSAGPASAGRTPAITNTSAGPTLNQELAMQRSNRVFGAWPEATAGTICANITPAMTSGTNPAGMQNSIGTKASWLATVKPNGVSKVTLIFKNTAPTERMAASGSN